MKTKLTFLLLIVFAISTITSAQEYYVNKIKKYNKGKTLRLEYIKHGYYETVFHFTYTGKPKGGKRTLMYLNNLRIVDKTTGKIYHALDNKQLKIDKKIYFFNTKQPIAISITFDKLPASVTHFDLIEDSKLLASKCNFSIKDIKLNSSKDVTDEFSDWRSSAPYPYTSTFYTRDNVIIDLWVDGVYIDRLTKYFFDKTYSPEFGDNGTVNVVFPSNKNRNLKGSANYNNKKLSWNFYIYPNKDCEVRQLSVKSN